MTGTLYKNAGGERANIHKIYFYSVKRSISSLCVLMSWWLMADRIEECESSDMETMETPAGPAVVTLSFAYQGLLEIPYDTILQHQDTLEVLDLSYNLLDEYPFGNQMSWSYVHNVTNIVGFSYVNM